jgi:26S proteasome regulatory subunit T3
VALHRHSNALVDVLPPEADSSISLLSQSEKPDVTYNVSEKVFLWVFGFGVSKIGDFVI